MNDEISIVAKKTTEIPDKLKDKQCIEMDTSFVMV